MENYAAAIYVIGDEVLNSIGPQDGPQSQMSNAEAVAFSIVTARYFYSNYKMAGYLCKKLKLFPKILSNSRLNRLLTKAIYFLKLLGKGITLIFVASVASCKPKLALSRGLAAIRI